MQIGGMPSTRPPPPTWSPDQEDEVKDQPKSERPRKYKVLFHNDDYTTMEFVVEVLRRFFHKNDSEALHIMLTVHTKGNAVAGVYSRDVAETKVAQVTDHAKQHGMPLLVTAEPD